MTEPRAVAVLPLPQGVVACQTTQNEPIKTTICELVRIPEGFNGKMVQASGAVHGGGIVGDIESSPNPRRTLLAALFAISGVV